MANQIQYTVTHEELIYTQTFQGTYLVGDDTSFSTSTSTYNTTYPATGCSYSYSEPAGAPDCPFLYGASQDACTRGPDCKACTIYGGSVQLLYFPVSTAAMNKTIANAKRTASASELVTAVYEGVTMTSPSVYISFQTAYAKNECNGTVGQAHTGSIIGLDLTDLSSALGNYHARQTDESQLREGRTRVSTFAERFSLENLNWPYPPYVWDQQSSCNRDINNQVCPLIISGQYNPILAVPSQIRTLDPAWATCALDLEGLYDPPRALAPAEVAAKPTAPGDAATGLPAAPAPTKEAPTPAATQKPAITRPAAVPDPDDAPGRKDPVHKAPPAPKPDPSEKQGPQKQDPPNHFDPARQQSPAHGQDPPNGHEGSPKSDPGHSEQGAPHVHDGLEKSPSKQQPDAAPERPLEADKGSKSLHEASSEQGSLPAQDPSAHQDPPSKQDFAAHPNPASKQGPVEAQEPSRNRHGLPKQQPASEQDSQQSQGSSHDQVSAEVAAPLFETPEGDADGDAQTDKTEIGALLNAIGNVASNQAAEEPDEDHDSSPQAGQAEPPITGARPSTNGDSAATHGKIVALVHDVVKSNPQDTSTASPPSDVQALRGEDGAITAFIIGSQTLRPGHSIVVAGRQISFDTAGSNIVVDDGRDAWSVPASDLVAVANAMNSDSGQHNDSPSGSDYSHIVDDQASGPGDRVTISGKIYTIDAVGSMIAVQTRNPITDTKTLPEVYNGKTLLPGGEIAVSGQTISLDSSGSTYVLVSAGHTKTLVLSESDQMPATHRADKTLLRTASASATLVTTTGVEERASTTPKPTETASGLAVSLEPERTISCAIVMLAIAVALRL